MGKLSLCMIVKNEEKYLSGCLESVKDVADEIIIVDTGSTDKTIQIAENYGAEIYSFDWVNDFSAARNFSLSKCTGDWILYLDADERLDKESISSLREIKKTNKRQGIYCSLYNVDEINNKPKLMKYTRLFKNSPGIKFKGRAHEQIEDSLVEKGYSLVNSKITITHLGYNIPKTELKSKARRNLNLLLKDYESTKSSYTAFQLGNTYSILNDNAKASQYYLLAMNDERLSKDYYAIGAAYASEYYMKINSIQDALTILEKGLAKSPDYPLLNLVGSEVLLKAGNGQIAVQLCIKANELNKNLINSKSSNNALDVIIDREKIIYHGLNIAVQKNIDSGISYFLTELANTFLNKSYSFDDESSVIVDLANSRLLDDNQKQVLAKIINNNNLDFYLELLDKYEKSEEKIILLKKFIEKYPDNILLYNKLGVALSKNGNLKESIEVYESSLERFNEDPTPIFYLIPLYIEAKEYSKVKDIISRSKEKFSGNIVFLKNLERIEDKVKKIVGS